MKSILISLLLFTITSFTAVCQSNARITDVDFLIEGGNIVVKYSIRDYQPGEVFFIRLTFVTGDNKTISPVSLIGDYGPDIKGGDSKLIVWDIGKDQIEVTGSLKAIVTILSSTIITPEKSGNNQSKPKEKQLGGPGYAGLSLILPGTGGYFVERNKTRAVIFNVISAVVLASVITQSIELSNNPADDQAERNRNQAAVTYAAIMATDVIWVAYKGFRNQKENRTKGYSGYNSSGVTMNYASNIFKVGYRITF